MTGIAKATGAGLAALFLTTALAGAPALAQQGSGTGAGGATPRPPEAQPATPPATPQPGTAGGAGAAQPNATAGTRGDQLTQRKSDERPTRELRWYEREDDDDDDDRTAARGRDGRGDRWGDDNRDDRRAGRGGESDFRRHHPWLFDDFGDRPSRQGRGSDAWGMHGHAEGRLMGPHVLAGVCGPSGSRQIGRMLERLERVTEPRDTQRVNFDKLVAAAEKARNTVRAACPTDREPPVTPPGRLAAVEGRVAALLEAIRTLRPALDEFYGSLTEEQKARLYMAMPMRGRGGDDRGREWRGRDDDRDDWRSNRWRGDRDDDRDWPRYRSNRDDDDRDRRPDLWEGRL